MSNFDYLIGKTFVRINTSLDLSGLSLYIPFIAHTFTKNPDVTVRIRFSDYANVKNMYQSFGNEIDNSATHSWVLKENKYYMFFSKRLQKIAEASFSDMWMLECNEEFTDCILNIPVCRDHSKIINELLLRPWMQRLFIARSWRSNYLVFHGALIELNGTGLLFYGDSGAGKSTMCDIIKGEKANIIADDRFIMDISEKSVCYGTPWNIKNPHYSTNKKTSASKIFILSHGNNQIKNISDKNINYAYDLMAAMLLPPFISPVEAIIKKITWLRFIQKNYEIYTFAFKPDGSVLPYINNPKDFCK